MRIWSSCDHRSVLMAAAVVGFVCSPCGAQLSSTPARQRLIGAWTLVSSEERLKDGTVRPYPFLGADGKGFLMYTDDGHVCTNLMNPHRPLWKNPSKPTAEEKIAAIDGIGGTYCGRFEVDEVNQIVYHYPEVAAKPNYVGSKQKRPYRFDGDLLVLSDKEHDEGEVDSWKIVWRKADKGR